VEFRSRSSLALALNDADVERLRAAMVWQRQQPGYTVRWLGPDEARAIEPRISDKTLGATHIEGGGDVEPYKLVLALTHAAERMGARIHQGRVVGLRREGGKATGVILERGELACSAVVLAGGPWMGEIGQWLGAPLPVRPLKGQILRLRAPGPSVPCSVGWGHNYATTKPDGLLWAGTTEEEAGFDEETTVEARDRISDALLTMLPPMIDAEIVYQTACLRPLAADGLLLLGRAPDLDNVYVATGGARKGILYGPPMARTIADLITTGRAPLALPAFSPARFKPGVRS
jgi:glycine/D-amino acid oxidase-like deaminating enzyme